jgi:alpha-L-fucosidase 2
MVDALPPPSYTRAVLQARRLPHVWSLASVLAVAFVALIQGRAALPAAEEPVVARNPDGNYLVPGVLGDVVYRRVGDVELSLDAYVQKRGPRRPAVLVVHGGGGASGGRIARVGQLLEMLTTAGFSWFSLDYRLAVLGESATGQMVAQVVAEPCDGMTGATDPVDREPCTLAAAVSFYGVYDLEALVRDATPRSLLFRLFGRTTLDEESRRVLRRCSPLYHAHGGMPPLLLIHGTDEMLSDQGVAFAEKLRAAGADHELVRLDGAGHGMESWEGRPEWTGYKQKLVDWLEAKLALGP